MAAPEMTTREQDLAFGDWLRTSLRQIGSNPPQLARHLGVRTTLVSAWLSGREAPTAEQCERIGSVLGVPARLVRRRAGLWTLRVAETTDGGDEAPSMPDEERSDVVVTEDEALPQADEALEAATTETPAAAVQVEMPAAPPVEEQPARPARRRRTTPARQAVAPEPQRPTTLLDPARPVGLRALADELEAAEQAHQAVQAEVERLRGECARLEEENRRLQEQFDRVRAVVLGEEGGSTTRR